MVVACMIFVDDWWVRFSVVIDWNTNVKFKNWFDFVQNRFSRSDRDDNDD
jgi:hypothetical protein